MKKAGIIGGFGFIESDVIALLLQTRYDVKVSTNDISKKENYQHLMELEGSQHLHVCEMNLAKPKDLRQFTKDCDLVIFMNPIDMTF